jgi:hypothetical protein
MAETEYNKVTPSRELIGGERFSIVVERDPPLFGISRIDTVAEAYDNVGRSRYFYAITPTREAVALGDQRVGTFSIRARLAESTNLPVSVGGAIADLGNILGFMRVRRVDAVDVQEATSVSAAAEKTEQEKSEGAGKTALERAAEGAKSVGTTAKAAFSEAFGLVKLAVVVAVAAGVFVLWRGTVK